MEFPEYVRMRHVNMWGTVTETFPSGVFDVEWEDGETSTVDLAREGVTWVRFPSRAAALTCLDLVRRWTGDNTATLYEPGHEGGFWAISLEGGPEEWSYRITEPGKVEWPEGVWVEAVNHFAISLHVK